MTQGTATVNARSATNRVSLTHRVRPPSIPHLVLLAGISVVLVAGFVSTQNPYLIALGSISAPIMFAFESLRPVRLKHAEATPEGIHVTWRFGGSRLYAPGQFQWNTWPGGYIQPPEVHLEFDGKRVKIPVHRGTLELFKELTEEWR